MPTIRQTANGALRKLGVLGAGREARQADLQDAVGALSGLYRAWITAGTFGRLCDVLPVLDYTARPNERIFRNSENVTTIDLPASIGRWWWDCGKCVLHYGDLWRASDTLATTPRDGSVVVISDAFTAQTVDFIYDGHTKLWQAIYQLTVDDEAPLSFRDPEGLSAALAVELADQFGAEVGPTTVRQAQRYTSGLASRWSMPHEQKQGVFY